MIDVFSVFIFGRESAGHTYIYIYIQSFSCLYLHLFCIYYIIFTYKILHVYFVYMAYIHLFIYDPLCIAGGPVKLRRWSS